MLNTWGAAIRRMPPPLIYAFGLAFEKALSFVTVPLVAHYLPPGEYGRYDVALSLLDCLAIVLGCCLGETMVRFISETKAPDEQRKTLSGFLFAALATTLVALVVVQLGAIEFARFLQISDNTTVVRLALACTALTSMADVALVWLRFANRADLFLLFTSSRALCQTLATWAALVGGYGTEGILVAGAIVTIAFVLGAFALIVARFGLRISGFAFEKQLFYGLPLVGAGLAMFALGNLNRWFLRPFVSAEEIGYFGMASRLMLLAPLLMQPYSLWWLAQRFVVLFGPDGLARNRRFWAMGISLMVLAASLVALAGPVAIALLLPASYAKAGTYLPLVLVVFAVTQLVLYSSVGTASLGTGTRMLAIDVAGAAVAITAYALLIPHLGVDGAIAGMLLGHGVRLAAYLYYGRRDNGTIYPLPEAAAALGLAAVLVAVAPGEAHPVSRLGWTMLVMPVLALFLYWQRLLWTPDFVLDNVRALRLGFLRFTKG